MSQSTEKNTVSQQNEVPEAILAMAQSIKPDRAPLLKTPADYGLEYEEVFFPSFDGVPLEAWFVPAESNKLIICNHPMMMNRYGFPGHLEPWKQFSDVEVDFNKVYKALHQAGYNVLTYDLRNHGRSGSANGGVCGAGLLEWRDVIGAMQYVRGQENLSAMTVGLFNPCAGGNAAMVAMTKHPEYFEEVKAFVCPQPCSMECSGQTMIDAMGLGEYMEALNREQIKLGGFANKEMSPHPYAPNVKMPTFIIQVRDDAWTKPVDVQTTYDLIPGDEKKLFWVAGTTKRFDGYNYFGEHPEQMIEFFDKYMN